MQYEQLDLFEYMMDLPLQLTFDQIASEWKQRNLCFSILSGPSPNTSSRPPHSEIELHFCSETNKSVGWCGAPIAKERVYPKDRSLVRCHECQRAYVNRAQAEDAEVMRVTRDDDFGEMVDEKDEDE